ncbi:MAG: hemolysin family protein, partial [Anaerolineae bacterium]
ILLIFCSACLSGSETALFSLSSMKVKSLKREKDHRKQLIATLLANPRDLLVTIIMLNILVNILVQNVVSNIFGDFSGWGLNVGVPLALTLIFGEVLPKSLAFANNEKIAYAMAPWIDRFQRLLLPIRKALTSTTTAVSSIMFFFLKKEEEISIDELQHALKTSRQYGVLNEDEAEIIHGYLSLQETTVKEHMRPREEVIFFDIEDQLDRLIHLFVDQECSRIPICQESLDNILGIMTSRLFFLHRQDLKATSDLLPILKKPYFVPESISAKALLRQLYDKKESIAIVVDEYGSFSGLIALEDLVEVVVGEIADRRDEKSHFTRSGEDVIIASGKLELFEFEEIFDIPLISENNMVTIGGWLTEQLGDIPKSGTKLNKEGFLFHVLSADPTRVRRVYIRRLKPSGVKKKKDEGSDV